MRTATGQCDSCELVRINGIVCHETGCPEAWRDERPECKWCGQRFARETRWQRCCSPCCDASYSGNECDCDSCVSDRVGPEEDLGELA